MMKCAVIISRLAAVILCSTAIPRAAQRARTRSSEQERVAAIAARVRPGLERDLAAAGLHFGDPVFVRAFKEEKLLELFVRQRDSGKFRLFRSYPIAAAAGELGPKLAEGDCQVPEGFYLVPAKAMNPHSTYHLAFDLGYPNAYDRALGRTGNLIMVHGNRVSAGCLAMTDAKIEEIYVLCDAAQRGGQAAFAVHLFPFRMTAERLAKANGSPWLEFWNNLKEGYDRFEQSQVPPKAGVKGGRYVFDPI
jgi:murein L,D-transpeptidase YafK